jgi:hypothetical protein
LTLPIPFQSRYIFPEIKAGISHAKRKKTKISQENAGLPNHRGLLCVQDFAPHCNLLPPFIFASGLGGFADQLPLKFGDREVGNNNCR